MSRSLKAATCEESDLFESVEFALAEPNGGMKKLVLYFELDATCEIIKNVHSRTDSKRSYTEWLKEKSVHWEIRDLER
jgi:hypothetical protein